MSSPLDAVPGGLIGLSQAMRIVAVNVAMTEISGRSAGDLLGESVDVLLSAPSRILFQTHVYPTLRSVGRVEEVFLTLASPAGEPTPVLLNAVQTLAEGETAFVALLVRIRARARWEADLLLATRALERERAASQQLANDLATSAWELSARVAEDTRNREFRDAFVGVVSHELRTPITTIYGMSHIRRRRHRSMDPATVDQHLEDMVAESDRLRRLTEDLLVLNRAEGGRLVVAAEPVALPRVVERTVDVERARSTGHQFIVDAPAGLPLVAGEEVYVEQVVQNLLSNATKYSRPGTTIHVAVASEAGGCAVRVVDEGPGLPDDDPDRLFELFYRAPGAIGQAQGAGIGLFVCRELIRAMLGRIWAAPASERPDGGAEFGFWLPAAIEPSDAD